MECIICGSITNDILIEVKGEKIYECKNCQLSITEKKASPVKKEELPYNINEYKKDEKRYRDRLTHIISHIKRHKQAGAVLDIGGGFGLLSSMLIDQGYHADTLEPYLGADYVKNNEKAHLIKQDIDSYLNFTDKTYDIIIMLDVLEHIKDPKTVLTKIKSRLNKDGILVLQMPNYKSVMAAICADWSWWMIEDHLFHFSPQSLHLLLNKTGFSTQEMHTYEEFADFCKNLDGNFAHLTGLKRKVQKALFLVFFIPTYILMRAFIWQSGSGGLIFAIVKE
jgi:2-polyprenyl-3-methyl-5-hydroxy-6-metoxy-1,4-benzoquinol methylase